MTFPDGLADPDEILVVIDHPFGEVEVSPQWFDDLVPSSVERDGIQYTIGAIDRDGPLLTTTIQYQVEHHRWTHTFTARCLTDDELAATLQNARFSNIRWLTADHSWLTIAAG